MSTPIEYVYVPVDRKEKPIVDKATCFFITDGTLTGTAVFYEDGWVNADFSTFTHWLKKVPITELVGDAVEFMNWTLQAECMYSCSDENQWTHIETGENITTTELYQLFKSKQ